MMTVNDSSPLHNKFRGLALGYSVLDTALYHRIAYQEAFAESMSVLEYDRHSRAAQEVQALFEELQEGV
jgi:cellulose biosynthesis protein BcsQ